MVAQVVPRGGVTAAAPRELRIDPCEKKSKRREFARWREGVLPVLPADRSHCHGVSIVIFFSGKTGTKFSKKIWVLPEIRRNWWCKEEQPRLQLRRRLWLSSNNV